MDLEQLINTSADLLDSGKADQAKVLCLKAIEIKPDCVEAWANLSFAELQLGKIHSAEQTSKRAIAIDPTHAMAWHNLGEVYMRMGLAEQSLQCNNRALNLDASQALFWFGRGNALVMLERYTEAMACFDKTLAIDPQFERANVEKEIVKLLSSPKRQELFTVALGIADMLSKQQVNDDMLVTTVKTSISNEPVFDKDLIQSFDYVAQVNIRRGNSFIIHFCRVNLVLATLLKDQRLISLCQNRLKEALSNLGSK